MIRNFFFKVLILRNFTVQFISKAAINRWTCLLSKLAATHARRRCTGKPGLDERNAVIFLVYVSGCPISLGV
jgi:hypothetical protein